MPTFDSGAYFLTTLIPIRTDTIGDDGAGTSPVHALRKTLSLLSRGEHSPFARNTRNHFARFVIIDDIAYNGREQPNTLLVSIGELAPIKALQKYKQQLNPVVAQPQDHLASPFLFFSSDFDATTGDAADRDSYLCELWETSKDELKNIFQFCVGFDSRVYDGPSFAKYIADCQLETTMPFHDYWPDVVPLGKLPTLSWPKTGALFAGVGFVTFGVLYWYVFPEFLRGLWFFLALAAGLIAGGFAVFLYVLELGKKPFPAAPNSTLPEVLKSLHLRREFTRFVIDNQFAAAGKDAASAQKLYDSFKIFVDANRPQDTSGPTQKPGAIGI